MERREVRVGRIRGVKKGGEGGKNRRWKEGRGGRDRRWKEGRGGNG